jgi:hypothetical protein
MVPSDKVNYRHTSGINFTPDERLIFLPCQYV